MQVIAMVLLKLLGVLLAIVGFFILKLFPDISVSQRPEMLASGLFIGAVLLVVGVALVIFG